MDMAGEYRIKAPRQKVWEGLNDPEILKQAIPGCEELDKVSDDELEAKVRAKIGPVNAKFAGKVTLSNIKAPESYTISGEGRGGAAGFAKGGANVQLDEDGDETVLRYDAKADVGGKLAQIGSRLVQGSAKKIADQFFSNFARIVAGEEAEGESAPEKAGIVDAKAEAPPTPPKKAPSEPTPPEPTPSPPPVSEASSSDSADLAANSSVSNMFSAPPTARGSSVAARDNFMDWGRNPLLWISAIVVVGIILALIV